MSDSSATPPAWIHKRDGQLVPFDADKISRALFAAGEELGHPDAFLARELTDGVVHFLSQESEKEPPTTQQISELVIKVVRELGQPALAEAFARHAQQRSRSNTKSAAKSDSGTEIVMRFQSDTPLALVLSGCARQYALQTVFARDLAAAQDTRLLTLTGLDAPDELSGCVLPTPLDPRGGIIAALQELRRFVSGFVVLDGPEHLLASQSQTSVNDFVRDLSMGLSLTRLRGIVNLNSAAPPSWAGELAEGPLFAAQRRTPHAEQLRQHADAFVEQLLPMTRSESLGADPRIDWHLSEGDFVAEAAAQTRLQRLTRLALEGAPLTFVFDRPRRPIALAEGIDRQHPALLLSVGLHLPRLALQSGIDGDAAKFLSKLGSLARLALSAGVQKREYLRRRERSRPRPSADAPALTSAFLLDRACLIAVPIGLDSVVRGFAQKGMSAGGAALDLGKQIVQRLRDVLRQDGRNAHLETCLDGPWDFQLAETSEKSRQWPIAECVAGLTAWDAAAAFKGQLRAAGGLHGVAEHGTLALFVPEDEPVSPEQVVDWLRMAWQQSDVVRLRLFQGRSLGFATH